VLTDGNDLHYVETHFGPDALDRPDIIYIYRTLTATIIKADLLRYLILYVEGGVYADIDVEALVPVDRWIPFHFNEGEADLVISVEIDEPTYSNHTILGPKSQSFCQWTIMSKPRNPAMLRIINNVVAWLADTARKQNVSISEITLNFDDVLSGTGPSAFTSAILAEMAHQTGHTVKWMDTFHNITEPRLVGNILVLTVEGFAAGQGHSHSHDHNHPQALVKHHYHASLWPSRHPRYSHPAYGIVEECNWKPECVAEWDKNTAQFPFLSEEEKAAAIAAKEQADKEKIDREEADRAREENERREREDLENLERCMKVVEEHGGIILGINLTKPEDQPEEKPEEQKNPEESQEGWILLQDGDAPPGSEAQKPQIQQPEEKTPEEQKSEEKKLEVLLSEQQKPEDKKPEEQKSEEKKPEDQKPEEKKTEEQKPEEKKVEEQKSEEQKPEAPKAPEETEVPSPLHAKIEAKGWGWHS
jgi:hypothetical protein